MQIHAETGVAGLLRGLAEGRRQVDGQALERRADAQAVVTAAQVDLQLVGQFARGGQRLLELQPLGQGLERYLAAGIDASLHLPALAFGGDLRGHRLAERLQGNVLAAEPLVEIEAEIAL